MRRALRPLLALLSLPLAACSGGEDADDSAAPEPGPERTLHVAPYLQSPTPEDAWILWVTDEADESWVEWGLSEAMGARAEAAIDTEALGALSEAHLEGLTPGADVYYRAHTDGWSGEIQRFRAPPRPGEEDRFLLVAMSDMQRNDADPERFDDVVNAGVIPWVSAHYSEDLAAEIGLVLIPGDLVDNGWDYAEWWGDFFAPAATLAGEVAIAPVPGNHEAGSPLFYRYFHLPEDGTPGYEERWWTTTWGNVRVVGLDSNNSAHFDLQLAWLEAALDAACVDPDVDFLFAQLHHPWRSELWPAGEEDFTGEVIARLDAFTEACEKPSVHLFGHTHGYSRGQSLDHRHLWVNVASAGGALDPWGGDAQNYENFSVSQSEWGFVVFEIVGGDDPALTLTRVSRGDAEAPLDNEVRDSVTIRRYDQPPEAPTPLGPAGAVAGALTLSAGAFSDPDGGEHGASRWQISADCGDFSAPTVDLWRQHEDWFGGEDLQSGADLTAAAIDGLAAGAWCWRVRYRDRGLSWSGWSEATAFTLSE